MIKGSTLRIAFISAMNNIANHRKEIDALNVFPVPDGDTGTNMAMTMGAAKKELQNLPEGAGIGDVSQTISSALLWGARGNSGVILSLLMRGFAKGLAGKEEASAADISAALEVGVEVAYKAVMKPTEGTILTVARESAQQGAKALSSNPGIRSADLWKIVTDKAAVSLEHTPELLPVLKKAGVVDAGGKGLLLIYQAMGQVFSGGEAIEEKAAGAQSDDTASEPGAAGEFEGEITFTYCTEFIVIKSGGRDCGELRGYLESIGDSTVVVEDEKIIKCHVHTDNPGDAMQKALGYGDLTKIKIENMREQYAAQRGGTQAAQKKVNFAYKSVDPSNEYGFVAVAAGDGVQELFRDLGVSNVVSGGQTMNPSTDNILEAIHATPAKTVIVLPNNKNIIMAAEQTVKLADRSVYVLPTKTIPQGLAALMVFDPDLALADNQLAMVRATEKVSTGLVTFAARDSNFDGHKIKKGEILALDNGKLAFVEKDSVKAAVKLAKSLIKKESSFVTMIYGEGVTGPQAKEAEAAIRGKLPDHVEFVAVKGGQPVYYYILSVE